jgi:hypothetical protein
MIIEDGRREVLRMIGVLVFIFASACYTEVIGIHSLFGAFLAGVVMPAASDLRDIVKKRLIYSAYTRRFAAAQYPVTRQTATLSRQAHNSRHLLSIGITLAAHLRSYVKHRSLDN